MNAKRFRITYRDDDGERSSQEFTMTVRATNVEDARDRFEESEDDDGWLIVRQLFEAPSC